jgi:acyl-CoA thioesterase FadM
VIVTEAVVATSPVTIRRRVRFGDCDPARIVYTVRYGDYAVSAFDLFMRTVLGELYAERRRELGVDFPLKALSFLFRAPLRTDDVFEMVVTVGEIRVRTFDLHVDAVFTDGTPVFEASLTPICVPHDGTRHAVPLPERVADLLRPHAQSSARRSSISSTACITAASRCGRTSL